MLRLSPYQVTVAVAAIIIVVVAVGSLYFWTERVRLNFIINDTATFRYDNKIKWRERERERARE